MANHVLRRRVFITGGTGSVGRALVGAFANLGHTVTFQYCRNAEAARELAKSCGASSVRIDFSRDFDLPTNDFEIVVNIAGINPTAAIAHEVMLADWNLTLAVNVTAPFRIVQLCLPEMIRERWGRIINVSSIYGLRGVENRLAYTVSKHALSGLTKTIAKEYARHGITCNEICPGPIESDMLEEIGAMEAEAEGISLETFLEEVRSGIPAGRLATPKDIASLAVFLASDHASYLTGTSIQVDGGMIA